MKKYIFRGLIFLTLVLGLGGGARIVQAQAPERPNGSTVLDDTGYLSYETIAQIDAENKTWEDTKEQLQVGVYIVDSLETDIETVANETFRKWQVGFSGTNNGILLLIAVDAREFRIETSDNAATVLTDVEAKQILDQSREFFRAENYDEGVLYIVDAIGDTFYGTNRSQVRLDDFEKEAEGGFESIFHIILLIVIIIWIAGNRGSGRGRGGGPGSLLWMLASSSSSSHHSSDSFGSSSGSGGWSGGGGGGGGASSGW